MDQQPNASYNIVDMVKDKDIDEDDAKGKNEDSQDQDNDHEDTPAGKIHIHGKDFTLSKKSLYLFPLDSKFRKCVIWIIKHKRFE